MTFLTVVLKMEKRILFVSAGPVKGPLFFGDMNIFVEEAEKTYQRMRGWDNRTLQKYHTLVCPHAQNASLLNKIHYRFNPKRRGRHAAVSVIAQERYIVEMLTNPESNGHIHASA